MKKIYTTFLCITLALSLQAQWTRTHVSPNANVTIEDLIEHNGGLYAALFDSGLVKLNETLNKWETVETSLPPSSNSAHITRLASSGNYLYAFVRSQYCASTTIYKSTDNGVTFVTDSSGHPVNGSFPTQCKGYPFGVQDAFVLNDKIITVVNGGFYSKYPSDAAWVKTTDPKVTFSELFGEYSNNWYAWSDNYKLHTSTDKGQTWTTPANTGLPALYFANVMNVNPENGRIYVAGSSLSTGDYKMLYSDNEGVSWDSLPINQILKKDWIGQNQKVLGMISKGNDITLMLVNNANNSHPDVFSSTDGGQTFTIDTVGLQPNAFGTVGIRRMLYFKGKLYLAPNGLDIYTQGTSSNNVNEKVLSKVTTSPNPSTGLVTVNMKNETIKNISVLNTTGQELANFTNLATLDISMLPAGMYILYVETSTKQGYVRIIKN